MHVDTYPKIMQTSVTKWGNSLAIRLPQPFAKQIGLNAKNKVEISVEKDRIIIKKPTQNLNNLLTKVTKENIHKESNTGNITGKEIW